jgi:hypothetical protein
MLLRRVTEHVRAQNWFAIGIDFTIVVVGVYIGIQVSNWNDTVRRQSLEESYLERLADEMRANIDLFEEDAEFALESRAALADFLRALNNPSTSDADLVSHAKSYISKGVVFASFRTSHATFDELKSTGNLDIIGNQFLRNDLVELNQLYEDGRETFAINMNWALITEGPVYLSFDALRFDARTSTLFPEQSDAESARQIRDQAGVLTRHAAMHYWLKASALGVLDDAARHSKSVLEQLESDR